jgi:NADH-quinone oxidoreductase subunit N
MTPPISIWALLPEIILLIGGCTVLLLGQTTSDRQRGRMPWVTLLALAAAGVAVLLSRRPAASGSGLTCGPLALFVRISALQLGILLTLVNWRPARERERGEFLSMLLFALAGLLLVGAADNLLILFLALELVSIPSYIMVVLGRDHVGALEAGAKYFFLGALATAITAYGFSFLYGVSGTAALPETLAAVTLALRDPTKLQYGLALIGVVLALGGLLFKIAAVPLHFYVADVYQGAASPVAGFLGFVPKLAGIVAIIKIVLLTGMWDAGCAGVFWLLWIIAAASMTVGNLLALRQTNIKRMLGYSGIAHSGYMLVGLLAGPRAGAAVNTGGIGVFGDGPAAVLYYVVIYGLANLGAFAVLGLLRTRGHSPDTRAATPDQECETLRDVAGLLRREPTLALLLALAMLTLMGLPPTPGFWGKLSLFSSAFAASRLPVYADGRSAWLIALVVIAVLNTALAAAYYLRVIAAVLVYENDRPARAEPREAQHLGALLCGFLLLIFAFHPSGLLTASQEATTELLPPAAASVEHGDRVPLDLVGLAPQNPPGLLPVQRLPLLPAVHVVPQ